MAPIREYQNWNIRATDEMEPIEPFRKYYFICEGANTETWYFQKLIDFRKQLGIHATIDIRLLEKTGNDQNVSAPKRLIQYAEEQKASDDISYDHERDKMVIVFDADIFKRESDPVKAYKEIISEAEKSPDNIVGVTNPSFELFLLLHYEESYHSFIFPHYREILENKKEGKKRYISTLFTSVSKMNAKSNHKIGELALRVATAIQEEAHINQDIYSCIGTVTSNIGLIIQAIQLDEGAI